jgi:hypothetical protein
MKQLYFSRGTTLLSYIFKQGKKRNKEKIAYKPTLETSISTYTSSSNRTAIEFGVFNNILIGISD